MWITHAPFVTIRIRNFATESATLTVIIVIAIIGVTLVAFGGIFSMLPSASEREIGKVRIAARKSGINVSIVLIDDINAPLVEQVSAGAIRRHPKKRCAAWDKYYQSIDTDHYPEWTLFVSDKDTGPFSGTHLLSELDQSTLLPEYWSGVKKVMVDAPPNLYALQCTKNFVRWLGQEKVCETTNEYLESMNTTLQAIIELNQSSFNGSKDAEAEKSS